MRNKWIQSCRMSNNLHGKSTEIGFLPNFSHLSTFYTDVSAGSVPFCNSLNGSPILIETEKRPRMFRNGLDFKILLFRQKNVSRGSSLNWALEGKWGRNVNQTHVVLLWKSEMMRTRHEKDETCCTFMEIGDDKDKTWEGWKSEMMRIRDEMRCKSEPLPSIPLPLICSLTHWEWRFSFVIVIVIVIVISIIVWPPVPSRS